MKILLDMNLSPEWGRVFALQSWETKHWIEVGAPAASDAEIMEWARCNGHVVFTHDLDFGALLAATAASGPSVVQLRCEDTRPEKMGPLVVEGLRAQEAAIEAGALVTIDPRRMRLTILPLRSARRLAAEERDPLPG